MSFVLDLRRIDLSELKKACCKIGEHNVDVDFDDGEDVDVVVYCVVPSVVVACSGKVRVRTSIVVIRIVFCILASRNQNCSEY